VHSSDQELQGNWTNAEESKESVATDEKLKFHTQK